MTHSLNIKELFSKEINGFGTKACSHKIHLNKHNRDTKLNHDRIRL